MDRALGEHWSGIEQIQGDRRWLEGILKKVFPVYDPYEPEVSEHIMVKTLLFPTESCHLDECQFQALVGAIERRKEQRFYISEIECLPNPFLERCNHWLCYRPTFENYVRMPIGVHNAIYSPDGTWGMLLSDELHAFLACDEKFWDEFHQIYPHAERDRSEFLDYWGQIQKSGVNVDWLPNFVNLLNK